MFPTILTYLQLFGVGLGFGVAGPCFLTCAPFLLAYTAGSQRGLRDTAADVAVFMAGRVAAYCILGAAAGFSGNLLAHLGGPAVRPLLKTAGGIVSIILGLSVMTGRSDNGVSCGSGGNCRTATGGLFLLGFTVGVSPCAPLTGLLFEIAMMSKNAFEGLCYAFFFGAGTFLSGIVIVGLAAGVFSAVPAHLLRASALRRVFRYVCGLLLITLGVTLIVLRRSL